MSTSPRVRMSSGGVVVDSINRAIPGLTPHAVASKKRRGLAIHAYVGANGSGKSLLVAAETIRTLQGISWSCSNPDHLHTAEGKTSGTRRVLSTMPFITPSGRPHPLYDPLVDYSQLLLAEHCDLILDEVGGAVASSTSDDLPNGVKAKLQELRRSEVVCRWTAPSWSRASKVLRETSQGVTLVQGFLPVAHNDVVEFDGAHDLERMAVDGETLEYLTCPEPGVHSHESGRMWGARRLMLARTFDANTFDEWTTAKREKVRPLVRSLFWRPGSPAESAYDTFAYVEKLNQITDSGRCDHCMGRKTPKKCDCDAPVVLRGSRRRAAELTSITSTPAGPVTSITSTPAEVLTSTTSPAAGVAPGSGRRRL